MASLRTATCRYLPQRFSTIAWRISTNSSITIHPTRRYAREICIASATANPSRTQSATKQARSFTTSYRIQHQREPGPSSSSPSSFASSQINTNNPTQTPSSGSTPPADPNLDSTIPPSKIYTFEDIQNFSTTPSPNRILIDVREPSELLGTGRIPTAKNIPISSTPDSFFLPAEEFEDRFGFDRPTADQEVVFYCKAGVRSKAAARLAGQAGFGGKIGEFPGSWVEWFERGGKVERMD